MKYFLLSIIAPLLIFNFISNAQTLVPKEGCYKNLRELRDNAPSEKYNLNIVAPENIKVVRGKEDEYYFYQGNNLQTSNAVLKKYAAISVNNDLYINCERLGVGSGFALVLDYGKYILFQATIIQSKWNDQTNITVKKDTLTGNYTSIESNPNGRHHLMYVLELATGKKTALTFGGMLQILAPFPEWQIEYVRSQEMDEFNTIVHFVKKINAAATENKVTTGKIDK